MILTVTLYCYSIPSLYTITLHRYSVPLLDTVTAYTVSLYPHSIPSPCYSYRYPTLSPLLYIVTLYHYTVLLPYTITLYRYPAPLLHALTLQCYSYRYPTLILDMLTLYHHSLLLTCTLTKYPYSIPLLCAVCSSPLLNTVTLYRHLIPSASGGCLGALADRVWQVIPPETMGWSANHIRPSDLWDRTFWGCASTVRATSCSSVERGPSVRMWLCNPSDGNH